jgi:hypothetical protein
MKLRDFRPVVAAPQILVYSADRRVVMMIEVVRVFRTLCLPVGWVGLQKGSQDESGS